MRKTAVVAIAGLAMLAAPAAMADGKATYDAKCKACHAENGKGSAPMATGMKVELKALDLTDDTKGKSEADLAKTVKDGLGGKMPSFNGKLDDGQISEVVKYVKGL